MELSSHKRPEFASPITKVDKSFKDLLKNLSKTGNPVFCPLASRFYDSVHGSIDTRAEAPPPGEPLIVPKQLPPQPAPQPQSQPRPRSHSKPAPAPAPVPQPVQGPSPPPQRARGFRNSRVFGVTQPSTTTTTTTTTTTARPAAPGPLPDYEYDYADYNDTVLATAASSIQMETVQKISDQLNVEKEAATVEGASPAKIAEEKIVSRQKRESDLWMLSRRKGQLNETVSLFPVSSFTCEDKITGVAYADIVSGCRKFFVCISVAKGKLLAYHLDCDKEKRFNQILGMCDSKTETKTCDHSERYYIYNKWYRASKRHLLDISKKQQSWVCIKMAAFFPDLTRDSLREI